MGARPSTFTLTTNGPVRLYSTQELLKLPPPTWLIEPILPAGGLVGLYGAPGIGKSFLAMDLALSVASAVPWQDHPTQSGYVVYISGEGGTGIGKRVQAWLQAHHMHAATPQLAWLVESIPIHTDSEQMATLVNRIVDEIERQPALVVIDTLARCFEGDENQQEDMGRFIAGVDKLRHEFDSTLLVIHHTGRSGVQERGSTAFRGAADTMLALTEKSRILTLACDKQKDAEPFTSKELELEMVDGTDSCVVIAGGTDRETRKKIEETLRILHDRGPLSWEEWRCSCSMPKSSFSRLILELKETGKIVKEKDNKWRLRS